MNPISDLNNGMLKRGIAAFLLVSALYLSVGVAHSDAIVQTAGGVSYVSGGVGTDSTNELSMISGNFNIKLVFALQSGNYVSDVQVVIADVSGKTLLDTTSAGPWFLARLPTGNYHVTATFADKLIKRSITVGKAKLQTVNFRWAAEQ